MFIELHNSVYAQCRVPPDGGFSLSNQAVVLVLEEGGDRCVDMMSSLLQHMAQTTIITSDQFKQVLPPSMSFTLCQ